MTAHDRRTYLRGAVENLLAQTLPRGQVQILVVKNFEDPPIDAFLSDQRVEHWVTSAGPLSAKVLEGLARARAPVIAFLEDDDRYAPDRLKTVVTAFRADPSLGFYRNGFTVIDEDGLPFHGWLPDAIRSSRDSARDLVVRTPEKDANYRALMAAYPDFNTSTMAIRRDILDSSVPYLRRIVFGVDRFLFHAGVAAPGTILLDRRPLTEYRFHPGNTGITSLGAADVAARLDRIMATDRADEAVMQELMQASPVRSAVAELEARRLVLEMYHLLRAPFSERRAMAGVLLALPRYRRMQAVRANRRLAFESAIYVLLPCLARRMHQRHLASWMRGK